MAEITSIEPQKKDAKRCNVYVDGRFYCGIKLEVAIKYRLKAGMQALTHISASPKTKKQIADFLSEKGYTEAVQSYVLERLEYYKFVDDYAYCRAYVQSVTGKGKRALEADLIKRGAERRAIEENWERWKKIVAKL